MMIWTIRIGQGKQNVFLCILTTIFLLNNNSVFGNARLNYIVRLDDTTIYTKPDKHPEFIGGAEALLAFINKNLKYPQMMLQRQYEGKVTVQFVVEKDGSLSNIKTLKGPGQGSFEEAMRLVKLLPKWKPGLDKTGQPIRVLHQLPVLFKLKPADIRKDEGVMKVSTY